MFLNSVLFVQLLELLIILSSYKVPQIVTSKSAPPHTQLSSKCSDIKVQASFHGWGYSYFLLFVDVTSIIFWLDCAHPPPLSSVLYLYFFLLSQQIFDLFFCGGKFLANNREIILLFLTTVRHFILILLIYETNIIRINIIFQIFPSTFAKMIYPTCFVMVHPKIIT